MASPSKPSSAPPPPGELRRIWRTVTWAGVLGTVYAQIQTSTPRARFLVQMGFAPFHFAVLETLNAVSLTMQIVSGYLANMVPRRKPLWIALIIASRLLLTLVILSPIFIVNESMRIWFILAVLFAQRSMVHLGTPMWLSWIADLVPKRSLGRHWASRQRLTSIARMVFSFTIAGAFLWFDLESRIVVVFGVMVVFAVALGVMDALMFVTVPEPTTERARGANPLKTLLEPIRDPKFRPFLVFLCIWKLAIAFFFPFVQVYMLEHVGLEVGLVQSMVAVGTVGMLASVRLWGLLSDTYGHRTVILLVISGRFIHVLSLFFCPLSHQVAIPLLFAATFVEGVCMAGVMVSFQTARMQLSPRRNRTMYIGAVNLLSMGVAGGIGAFGASFIVKHFQGFHWNVGPYSFVAMHIAFLVSIALRLVAVWAAWRIPQPFAFPLRDVGRHVLHRHILSVLRAVNELADSPEPSKRIHAARRLGALRSALAFRELIAALKDPVRGVRHAAADALGRIGLDPATKPLGRALADPESGIQQRAAQALGRIGGAESAHAILDTLDTLDGENLISGIQALGRIGDAAALAPLIRIYQQTPDRRTRREATSALAAICGAETPESIIELLSSRSIYRERYE